MIDVSESLDVHTSFLFADQAFAQLSGVLGNSLMTQVVDACSPWRHDALGLEK